MTPRSRYLQFVCFLFDLYWPIMSVLNQGQFLNFIHIRIFHFIDWYCYIALLFFRSLILLMGSTPSKIAHTMKMCDTGWDPNLKFPIVNFPFLCSNIPAALAHGVSSDNSFAILEPVANTMTSLIEPGCWLISCSDRDMIPRDYGHHSRNSMVAAVIWLTVTEYLFNRLNGYVPSTLLAYSLFHWISLLPELTWSARRVSYKKQEMLTLPVHLISPQFLRGPCRSSFYRCSFGHCIVLVCMCLSCSLWTALFVIHGLISSSL